MALVILLPVILILSLCILFNDGAPIFFCQVRSGKNFSKFQIYKFRTMLRNTEDERALTSGNNDIRITKFGKILRKYKLDELPQLLNIFEGSMSLVGPRPQVPYYTEKFKDLYSQVLLIKPGVLSTSAICFMNEEIVLEAQSDPVTYYEKVLIPLKCQMDIEMISGFDIGKYLAVVLKFVQKTILSK